LIKKSLNPKLLSHIIEKEGEEEKVEMEFEE
jgi:hypothetical protein